MRKQIYLAIIEKLSEVTAIQHFDLWNRNVEFIEDEVYAMPAVFIEFGEINYKSVKDAVQSAILTISLHIVTQVTALSDSGSSTQTDALAFFDLIDSIHVKLYDLSGTDFCNMHRVRSVTNHDHGDVLENVEIFECSFMDRSAE